MPALDILPVNPEFQLKFCSNVGCTCKLSQPLQPLQRPTLESVVDILSGGPTLAKCGVGFYHVYAAFNNVSVISRRPVVGAGRDVAKPAGDGW